MKVAIELLVIVAMWATAFAVGFNFGRDAVPNPNWPLPPKQARPVIYRSA